MKKIPEGFKGQRLVRMPTSTLSRCKKLPIIRDLYVTDIGHYSESRHHWVTRPQGAPSHILIYCSSGSGWIREPGCRRVRVPREGVVLIPAGRAHEYGASKKTPWQIHWVHFQGLRAEEYLRVLEVTSPFKLHSVPGADFIVQAFEDTYRALRAGASDADLLAVSTGLARTLALIHRERRAIGAKSRQTEERIARSIEWMTAHLSEPLTLPQLAKEARLSVPHYSALFKQQIGCSPMRQLSLIRMRRASELLEETDLPINEIAFQVGYENPFHFSRVFKSIVGLPPSHYRNS
ncbi:MAG: AraC family transcriptional regulator [Verrucomicrobia bacterium]|nr:AraC family transcriptional regulator [Verrucomicrobiota bacterium]MCH8511975.1 AraC family transcriptional regulator [Kiritimatiellia bacterium]